jgi:hypothetical protein
MDKHFYSYYTKYGPWCIDIVFLSYMVNELGADWQTKTIKTDEIKTIINDYFENNPVVLELFIKDEQNIWKSKTENYFNLYVDKPWKTLYDDLIKYCFTWDNFSINIMYLFMFYDLELITFSTNTFLNKYIELLKKNIIKSPNERHTPQQTKKSILKLFKSVYRKNLNNLKKIFKEQYDNTETIRKVEKNIAVSILDNNKKEKVVYEESKKL